MTLRHRTKSDAVETPPPHHHIEQIAYKLIKSCSPFFLNQLHKNTAYQNVRGRNKITMDQFCIERGGVIQLYYNI